jgi:hypothetical protein
VTAIPADVSRVVVEDELPPAIELCQRIGWDLKWAPDALVAVVKAMHPKTSAKLCLVGDFNDYKGTPPAWRFVDPDNGAEVRAAWPAAGAVDGKASIFHTQPVICAPFNRLAYKSLGGPHQDWGGPETWLSQPLSDAVRATSLAEMLQVIRLHLAHSPGMLK